MFITETGWRHSQDGYPSVDVVNDYLDLTLRGNNGRYPHYPSTDWTPWLDDPRIITVTPFALNQRPSRRMGTHQLAKHE